MRALRLRRIAEHVWEATTPEPLADVVRNATVTVAGKSTDEQVQRALLEARSVTFALQRLGQVARPDLAWRCARAGEAFEAALKDSFGGMAL